jgi:hypothetical protein
MQQKRLKLSFFMLTRLLNTMQKSCKIKQLICFLKFQLVTLTSKICHNKLCNKYHNYYYIYYTMGSLGDS